MTSFKSKFDPPKAGDLVIVNDSDWTGNTFTEAVRVDYKERPSVSCFFDNKTKTYWRFVDINGERIAPIDSGTWSIK